MFVTLLIRQAVGRARAEGPGRSVSVRPLYSYEYNNSAYTEYRSRFATNPFGFGGERAEYISYHDYRDSKLRAM